jgi:hypothetical protein
MVTLEGCLIERRKHRMVETRLYIGNAWVVLVGF